jgi:hypothetical protein
MKKLIQLSLMVAVAIFLVSPLYAQKKVKEGIVKFTTIAEASEDMAMAMMSGTKLDLYFSDENQRMDMNLMGGLMRVQTIVPTANPKDAVMLMDMMGQKFQIVGLTEDDVSNSNTFMNLDQIDNVEYDVKVTKEIAGYPCYFAKITMKNGLTMQYFITEKIQPPVSLTDENAVVLKGYPLEMNIIMGEGLNMTFVANEVITKIPKGSFDMPSGYKKMTMEEFEKQMGGMKLGF